MQRTRGEEEPGQVSKGGLEICPDFTTAGLLKQSLKGDAGKLLQGAFPDTHHPGGKAECFSTV